MAESDKVLVIIPARYESRRFPGKLLAKIDELTVIERVVQQVLACSDVDDVVVATDDVRIAGIVAGLYVDVVLTSSHYRNGTERVASLLKDFPDYQIVINVQGDEPFLDPVGLSRLIHELKQTPKVKIASLRAQIRNKDLSKHIVKVVVDEKDWAVSFSRSLPQETSYEHIGVYGFRKETLEEVAQLSPTESERANDLEQLRWLNNGYQIKMIVADQATPSIDVPEDIATAEQYLKNLSSEC